MENNRISKVMVNKKFTKGYKMKLGCVFKSLAILIVVLGTTFYLYDKYGKDFVELGKEKAKEMALEELDKILSELVLTKFLMR